MLYNYLCQWEVGQWPFLAFFKSRCAYWLTVGLPHWLNNMHLDHEDNRAYDDGSQSRPGNIVEVRRDEFQSQNDQSTCKRVIWRISLVNTIFWTSIYYTGGEYFVFVEGGDLMCSPVGLLSTLLLTNRKNCWYTSKTATLGTYNKRK